jgi:hypothetical protein
MMLTEAPKGTIGAVGSQFSSCTFSLHTFSICTSKSVHLFGALKLTRKIRDLFLDVE